MAHHPRCIENALGAIAENNAVTILQANDFESEDVTSEIQALLTPETEEVALEWLANGNKDCYLDGELCGSVHS